MTAPRFCPASRPSVPLRAVIASAVLLSALLLSACGSEAPPAESAAPPAALSADAAVNNAPEPVDVLPQGSLEAVALELGVALDGDGRVAQTVERARRSDTVHVSVVTVGEAEAVMLTVRWRDADGKDVAVDERAITAAGPAVHTFSHTPEGGWTPGRYEVEVLMSGESAGLRAFEVR